MQSRIDVRPGPLGPRRIGPSPRVLRALPAALLVALAACADEPTSAPVAGGSAAGAAGSGATIGAGGYRLTISGIGTPEQASTIVADGGSAGAAAAVLADGLRRDWSGGAASVAPGDRGLTPRPSAFGFQFLTTGSYTYGTRGSPSAFRYVYSIYRVRNATGATLVNPSLLAAFTSGTLGSTAISDIRLAGNVAPDAATGATLARSMLPAGASILTRSGQPTGGRTDVLQIFSEADVKAVTLPSAYTALAYGFSVLDTTTDGRSLAASASGVYPGIILFAFKLPLQATASQDVFTFTYNFFAVTDAETRVTQSLEETDAASASAASARATALGASEIHVLRGSSLAGLGTARVFCGFRISGAGTVASPATYAGTDCSGDFTALTVTPTNATLSVGQTRQLTATATPAGGSTTPTAVSYQSGNPAVATVSASGLVTAVAPGTATIYVSTFASPRTTTSVIQVNP